MKSSIIVRLFLATLFATLASIGFGYGITLMAALWPVTALLLMETSELTKPIPRYELWPVLLVTGVLLAVLLALPFLHLSRAPEPHGVVRTVLAALMWIAWLFAVYSTWRREKGKAGV